MNFEAGEDLAVFRSAVDRLAARRLAAWKPCYGRHERDHALEAELHEGGFFDGAAEPSLGLPAAVGMVFELARLPVCAEVAASALLGPLLGPGAPRPIAVLCGRADRPARYLPGARAVLHLGADGGRSADLRDDDVQALDSAFAYPMGRLQQPQALHWQALDAATAGLARQRWCLGVAAELLGCLQAGLDSVVAHVTERRQFGRPLGAFQGIQHRLAAASCSIEGGRWLMLKAAHAGTEADAAAALGMAQSITTRVVYDLHQFMGAMGLTLEHPLHRWTYRAKLLRSELDGADRQFQDLADRTWGDAPPSSKDTPCATTTNG